MSKLPNKGTGAGGANTNKTGLSYEDKKRRQIEKEWEEGVDHTKILCSHKNFVTRSESVDGITIVYNGQKILWEFVNLSICGLTKSSKKSQNLQPDYFFIKITQKKEILCCNIYIIEIKFQQVSGSVEEKIQTGLHKKKKYERRYEQINKKYKCTFTYIYVLSNWYKKEKLEEDIDIGRQDGIHFIWGSSGINVGNEEDNPNLLKELFSIMKIEIEN